MPKKPPLTGIKVIELGGLAPAPFAGMLLADFGADVVRIDKPGPPPTDVLCRRKRSLQLNLKSAASKIVLEKLLAEADVLIDPFRPGVLEGLDLDPKRLMKVNEKLIITRLTGFRTDGKYKDMAGHDINYLATSGVLSLLGRSGSNPHAPGNLLADFAGGGLVCALAIILALYHRQGTGKGQLVDVNMVDGLRYLATLPMILHQIPNPLWSINRGTNILDGGAPYYDTYKTKDGEYMSVGSLEPQFYAALLEGLELDPNNIPNRDDQSQWDELRRIFTQKFAEKTQKEWEAVFDGTDSCVTPVIPLSWKDNRPIAGLNDSPSLDISKVNPSFLTPGTGGSQVLKVWLGWSQKDFIVDPKGTVNIKSKANL